MQLTICSALRTYGKILQRQMTETESRGGTPTRLLELVERLMTQSERVVDLMIPMDNLVNDSPLFLNPAKDPSSRSLVLFEQTPTPLPEAESQNIEDFSRDKAGLIAFSPQPENVEFNNTDNGIHQFGVAAYTGALLCAVLSAVALLPSFLLRFSPAPSQHSMLSGMLPVPQHIAPFHAEPSHGTLKLVPIES